MNCAEWWDRISRSGKERKGKRLPYIEGAPVSLMEEMARDVDRVSSDPDKLSKRISYRLNRLYGYVWDGLHMMKYRLNEGLKFEGSAPLSNRRASTDPYTLARTKHSGWSEIAGLFVRKGVHIMNDKGEPQKISRSVEEVLTDPKYKIAENYDLFGQYLKGRRLLSMEQSRGAGSSALSGKIAQARLEAAREYVPWIESRFPAFKDAANDLHDFSRATLDWLVSEGVMTQGQRDVIADSELFYAPLSILHEALYSIDGTGVQYAGSMARRMFKIGDAAIMHPVEALVRNTYSIVGVATSNMVKQALADVLIDIDNPDIGHIVHHARGHRVVKAAVDQQLNISEDVYSALADELSRGGASPSEIQELIDAVRKMVKAGDTNPIATLFLSDLSPREGEIQYIRKDGTLGLMKVDPDIYQSLKDMRGAVLPDIMRMTNKLTGMLRAGAVLNPEFAMRNPLRDIASAAVIAGHAIDPTRPQTVIKFAHSMAKAFSEVVLGKESGLYRKWIMSGGALADLTAIDRSRISEQTREMLKTGKKKRLLTLTVKHPHVALELMRSFSGRLEALTRLAVFDAELNELLETGMDPHDATIKAALESREASVDFARRGVHSAQMNTLVAFFNANIQGMDKFVRTMLSPESPSRAKAITRGFLMITLPSLLHWRAVHKEQWYQQAPRWEKNMFWLFSPDGGKTVIRLPKPFEVGLFFGSLFERLAEKIEGEDPRAMEAWFRQIGTTINPYQVSSFVPPLSGAAQAYFNYDWWRGTDIVKGTLGNVDPALQYTEKTTSIARLVGRNLHVSPMKIDFYVRAAFGGLGRYAADILSVAADVVDPDLRKGKVAMHKVAALPYLPDITTNSPVLRGFIEKEPIPYSRFTEDFFDYLDAATIADQSVRWALKGRASKRELARVLRDEGFWYAMSRPLHKIAGRVADLTGLIMAVRLDQSGRFTPEEKRKKIDHLVEARAQLMERAARMVDEYRSNPKKMERLMRQLRTAANRVGR